MQPYVVGTSKRESNLNDVNFDGCPSSIRLGHWPPVPDTNYRYILKNISRALFL